MSVLASLISPLCVTLIWTLGALYFFISRSEVSRLRSIQVSKKKNLKKTPSINWNAGENAYSLALALGFESIGMSWAIEFAFFSVILMLCTRYTVKITILILVFNEGDHLEPQLNVQFLQPSAGDSDEASLQRG